MTEITEDARDKGASKIDLVRKLLAKAESTDSAAERDALNERASQLIAAYGIDDAMLASQDESLDKITDVSVTIERPFALDFRELLANIAIPCACGSSTPGAGTWTRRLGRHRTPVRLRLRHSPGEAALPASAESGARGPGEHQGRRLTGIRDRGRAGRQQAGLHRGFRRAILDRLNRTEKDAKAAEKAREDALRDQALLDGSVTTSASVELVLADRKAKVQVAFTEAFPKLRKGQARNLSGLGHSQGYRDGQKASLGTGKAVSSGTKSIS